MGSPTPSPRKIGLSARIGKGQKLQQVQKLQRLQSFSFGMIGSKE